MGISITPYINDEFLSSEERKGDGKSLADYFIAYRMKDIGLEGVSTLPLEVAEEPSENDRLQEAFEALDAYLDAEGKEPALDCNLNDLEALILQIRASIEEQEGEIINALGEDVSQYKDGAICDCNDILNAIRICKQDNKTLKLEIG